jgi:hypothetical protein
MMQHKHLLIAPILLAALIFLISGSLLFGLIFTLILGLMSLDFLGRERNSAPGKEEKAQAPSPEQNAAAREEDYRILGLKPGANLAEVRRVYKNLASQFHPDTGIYLSESQRKSSGEAFLKIREAHDRIIKSRGKD